MKIAIKLFWAFILITSFNACENREINQEEGPNFSEIHEDTQYNFDEVEINGLKYLILEKDRNNPHEGFGFMALKGEINRINQDSIKAYLKISIELQNMILSKLNNQSLESLNNDSDQKLLEYLPVYENLANNSTEEEE
jgi:hypothetical protein